jgi:glycosyltransferase involved in cell wall biosynthesis
MKVLMWGRYDLRNGGGDEIQIEQTAKELRKLGVEVDVSTTLKTDPSPYDIVHLFQLDWIPETYLYAKKAKKYNKPLVFSPIHHNVSEVKRFDEEYLFGFRRFSKYLFRDQHARDTWKNIYRAFFNSKKRIPTLISILMGLKRQHTKTLSLADKILVQTELEAKDLEETYGVTLDWTKVPNGVSGVFLEKKDYPNVLGFEDYILCVGRIEARKNQLTIISAVEGFIKEEDVDVNLVFVGKKSVHHGEFVKKFDKEVAKRPWVTYVSYTPNEEMPGLFQHAKLCVSASWFETSGLTSMEALFMDTNAVAAGDRAKEFLGEWASYCDPGDIDSLKKAISTEYSKPRPMLPDTIRSIYTWENVAKKTKEVYASF